MTVAVYLPLLMALPVAFLARRLTVRGDPGVAVWTLTASAVAVAAASTWSLTLLALTLLDDVPPLRALDDRPGLDLPEPVPGPVALLAGVVLLAVGWRLLADVRRRVTTNRRLRVVGAAQAGLVVADLDVPMAVAVPGRSRRPGHLLLTTGMMRLLDPDERRVVVAHEQAHLRRHHHRFAAAVGAAAALNPLLRPVRDAVALAIERWADEDAAAEVADRDLAAQAVARAALAATSPAGTLGIGGDAAVHRVRALIEPPPARLRRRLVVPLLLGPALLSVGVFVTAEFVELARAWLVI